MFSRSALLILTPGYRISTTGLGIWRINTVVSNVRVIGHQGSATHPTSKSKLIIANERIHRLIRNNFGVSSGVGTVSASKLELGRTRCRGSVRERDIWPEPPRHTEPDGGERDICSSCGLWRSGDEGDVRALEPVMVPESGKGSGRVRCALGAAT